MVNAVTYILENDSTIQSLIGQNKSGSKTKVYPVVVPETEKAPYIVCRVAGRVREGKDCDSRYQIEVISYANSYDDLNAINDAIITALESEPGGTINGVSFSFAVFNTEMDGFEKDHDLYSKMSTFSVYGL